MKYLNEHLFIEGLITYDDYVEQVNEEYIQEIHPAMKSMGKKIGSEFKELNAMSSKAREKAIGVFWQHSAKAGGTNKLRAKTLALLRRKPEWKQLDKKQRLAWFNRVWANVLKKAGSK